MPDPTPEETDRCDHCGAVLRDPPGCCEAMQQEYDDQVADALECLEEARREREVSDRLRRDAERDVGLYYADECPPRGGSVEP